MLLVRFTFEHYNNCGVVLAKFSHGGARVYYLVGVSHLPDIMNGDYIVSFDPS